MNKRKGDSNHDASNATQKGTLYPFFNKIARPENNNSSDAVATTSSSQTSAFVTKKFSYQPDIGTYIKNKTIDEYLKFELIERHWVPSKNYIFPHCTKEKKGQQTKIYFRKAHLENFNWLVLSHEDKGLYCKYCAIQYFQTELNTGLLVTVALKDFDHLGGRNGTLKKHERGMSHKDAVEMGKQFILKFQVITAMDVDTDNTQVNKEWVRPLVKTIIFCGRQNIPLRCYMDNAKIMEDQQIQGNNKSILSSAETNLSALLNYREETVESDLEIVEPIATHVSETAQNKIINVCMEIIQESIVENVKKSKYFSILFDEATDITSHNTQLCLSVRYLNNKIITEDFLTFCNTKKMFAFDEEKGYVNPLSFSVGEVLVKFVENIFDKFDVNLTWCVGIGIDNCSSMSPETKNTVVRELSKRAKDAKRCPSSNYILNHSLALTSCRNTFITMRKVVEFASATTERQTIFDGIFGIRWEENHNGYELFQGDNLIKICSVLEKISKWQENKTAYDAYVLLQALRNSDFIMSSLFLNDILGVTEYVSEQLQRPTSAGSLKRATTTIRDAKNVLQNKRKHAVLDFSEIFKKGKQVTEQLGVNLRCPTVESQDTISQPAGKYYTEVYINLLDSVINDLEDRLSPHVIDLFQLGVLFPEWSSNDNKSVVNESVKRLASSYVRLIDNATNQAIEKQYELWMAHWRQNNDTMPLTLSEMIANGDEDIYPMIQAFFNILASLPVSVPKAGMSSSMFHHLIAWLRSSTTAEDHLTGLALLYIYKNKVIDVKEVVDRFMK